MTGGGGSDAMPVGVAMRETRPGRGRGPAATACRECAVRLRGGIRWRARLTQSGARACDGRARLQPRLVARVCEAANTPNLSFGLKARNRYRPAGGHRRHRSQSPLVSGGDWCRFAPRSVPRWLYGARSAGSLVRIGKVRHARSVMVEWWRTIATLLCRWSMSIG